MSELGEKLSPSALAGGVHAMALHVADKLALGRHFITGSDSSAFVRVNALVQPHLKPEDYDWLDIAADPDASSLRPRSWTRASVVGALQRSMHSHNGIDYTRLQDAVAWLEEGQVVVATGIEDDNLFGGKKIDGENGFTVAKRREPKDRKMTMGLWDGEAGKLLVPSEVVLLEDSIPTAQLAGENNYPNTSLI